MTKSPPVLLASASPRRQALLEAARIDFRVLALDVDETPPAGIATVDAARMIAVRKADAARAIEPSADFIVTADTIVSIDGKRLGKPQDAGDARSMLLSLAGREHEVITGLAVACHGRMDTAVHVTVVRMRSLEQAEVAGYIAAAEWSDAAGGYRIQERGGMLVEWIRGSYSNVVGLPMEGLYVILRRNGYRFW